MARFIEVVEYETGKVVHKVVATPSNSNEDDVFDLLRRFRQLAGYSGSEEDFKQADRVEAFLRELFNRQS